MKKLLLSTLFLLPVLGCMTDDAAPPDDDATYTRTIVRLADDGSATVTTEPITAAEQQLEHEAAVAAQTKGGVAYAVATDSCADWYATKFFDQTGYTGNELCLIGTGNGALDQYCRRRFWPSSGCLASWSMAARSMWTGAAIVWMYSVYHSGGACGGGVATVHPAYEAYATLDSCEQLSDQFTLQAP